MGIYLSDHDHDCFTNLRFADDVLLFESSKEQLQKMLCEFNRSTEWQAKSHEAVRLKASLNKGVLRAKAPVCWYWVCSVVSRSGGLVVAAACGRAGPSEVGRRPENPRLDPREATHRAAVGETSETQTSLSSGRDDTGDGSGRQVQKT